MIGLPKYGLAHIAYSMSSRQTLQGMAAMGDTMQ